MLVLILSPPASSELPEGCSARPLAERPPRRDAPGFVARPSEEVGIDFRHTWNPPRKYFSLIDGAFVGGGVAIGDIDGDQRPDLYFSRPFGGGQLYRNLGDWKFENITAEAGLGADAFLWGSGCTMADIDNDGDLDLSICGYERNRIFLNDGKGAFTESAAACGLAFSGASIIFAWADYDNDGDLDAYLVTNRLHTGLSAENRAELAVVERKLTRDPATGRYALPEDMRENLDVAQRADGKPVIVNSGQADRLYRNDGPASTGFPRFTEVTRSAGLWDYGRGLSAVWWDHDGDGRLDLYVANDFAGADRLWHNNGDGTFSDRAPDLLPHTPWFSMGSDAGDINNDGLIDLVTSDMAGSTHYKEKMGMTDVDQNSWFLEVGSPRQYMRNALYLNSGGALPFMEIAHLAGVVATDWTWAVKLGDLDCDGWLDLYVTNGMTGDFLNPDLRAAAGAESGTLKNAPRKNDANMAFRNRGDLRFENVGKQWGLERESVSFGAAYGDLDGDGDLDIVVNNFDDAPSIYENCHADGERAVIRLIGREKVNRGAIGAVVTARAGSLTLTRDLTCARGFASSDEPLIHLGLGNNASIDELTILWPGGRREQYRNLPAGQLYTLVEGATNQVSAAARKAPSFERSKALANVVHRERAFNDFARQPLLPWKLSQLGPALAWGDVDGDGDHDLFQGGAAGSAATLAINEGDKGFVPRSLAAFQNARECEDLGALFFDADGDNDLDLYVVSGGVECDAQSSLLQDRLYLNDSTGRFSAAVAETLPPERDSGSAVCAADVDRDGDLDLFVGGRVSVGEYPLSPGSRLLRNEAGKKFADATAEAAPELSDRRKFGRVTAAVWSDIDGDGWLDLLVATEWGAIRLLQNRQGRLADVSEAGGTDHTSLHGWWNGIAPGDLDNDGDIDFVATNFGLNTRYQPAAGRPVSIFYGEMDESGLPHLIEAVTDANGMLLPVRGKNDAQTAIPLLREKIPTFHAYASSTLEQIFGRERLDAAQRFNVETVESAIFWNESTGGAVRFSFQPLPRIAQIAPAFGVQIADVNLDGRTDIYLVHNFRAPHPKTGRMDGGVSLLLLGTEQKRMFQPVWPNESGLVITGDAKSLTICDLNNDGRPDFVAGINDDAPAVFENRSATTARPLVIRLRGSAGNPTAVGARVMLRTSTGRAGTAEVYAGTGYLSQSMPELFFALASDERVKSISVRWPDGRQTERTGDLTSSPLLISQTTQKPVPSKTESRKPKGSRK